MNISKAEDLIFTRRRLMLCGYVFLAGNVIAFAMRYFSGTWMIDRAGNIKFTDFIEWWLASRVAWERGAATVYDFPAFSAAQALVTKSAPPVTYYAYVYPPTMLLLFEPIARLPYVTAFFVWIAATLGLYAVALYSILPSVLTIVLALAPAPAVKCVFGGDSTFLTAALLGLSLVFIRRRPYLAGIFIGILTYKPQFVFFFPLALVITGQWRVIAAASASAGLLAAAAVLKFGSNAWLLFLRSTQSHDPVTFLVPSTLDALNQTTLGLMHRAGAGPSEAWGVHLAVAILITAIACAIWMRPVPDSLKAAAFSIGVLTVTPYVLAYDLAAFSVPAAFLLADAVARGFLPGERFILLGCFLGLYLCFNFVVGPIILMVLMGLVVRRVRYLARTSAVLDPVAQ